MVSENKHMVLEVSNLSVGYISKKRNHLISEGINFSIKEGELVGLVGINGIGKSTLLRTLSNMQPSLKGVISINKIPLENLSSLQLAKQLSIVLTETLASQNLSVLELVSLGRHPNTNWIGTLSETDQLIIQDAITATEIEALIHQKCFELSDGQLQRVLIARALAQDTPIILLDEPTTHLDIYHRAYILKLLKRVASEKNKIILYATHEIDLAIQLSDKMLVMKNDNVFFNSPEKLMSEGCFDNLFPSETIYFDTNTKRFILK